MRRLALISVLALLSGACENATQPGSESADAISGERDSDHRSGTVVQVAPPSGDPALDVASIEAAVAAASVGSVIQFAPGIYAIEPTTQIVVSVPGVTLQGHRQGTTIRGEITSCPDLLCGHFLLNGGHQTIRRLTFEQFGTAVSLGAPGTTTAGYRVLHSTFRDGDLPIDFVAFSDEVSVLRDNDFINVTLPFIILGKTVHFRGNRVTAPDPTVPPFGQPFNAGVIIPEFLSGINVCEHNVFQGNTIVGNADGFIFLTFEPGTCRHNIIRGNTFIDQKVFTNADNGSMVWLDGAGVVENLIAGNELRGSAGLGVILVGASDNRIINNEFRDLPGGTETFIPFSGTAIFLDEATSRNRVRGNTFEHVLTPIVDLGTDNIIGGQQPHVAGEANIVAERQRTTSLRSQRLLEYPKLRQLRP